MVINLLLCVRYSLDSFSMCDFLNKNVTNKEEEEEEEEEIIIIILSLKKKIHFQLFFYTQFNVALHA